MASSDFSPKDTLKQIAQSTDVIEQARLITYLYKEEFYTLKEIADYLKKHPSYISHLVRIVKLPELVIDGYYSHTISIGHLIILSRLHEKKEVIKAFQMILSNSLTASQTELLIRDMKFGVVSDGVVLSKEDRETAVKKLEEVLPNSSVSITQSHIKARIQIDLKGDRDGTTATLKRIIESLLQGDEQVAEQKGTL